MRAEVAAATDRTECFAGAPILHALGKLKEVVFLIPNEHDRAWYHNRFTQGEWTRTAELTLEKSGRELHP
jgi:hypothetical protein